MWRRMTKSQTAQLRYITNQLGLSEGTKADAVSALKQLQQFLADEGYRAPHERVSGAEVTVNPVSTPPVAKPQSPEVEAQILAVKKELAR